MRTWTFWVLCAACLSASSAAMSAVAQRPSHSSSAAPAPAVSNSHSANMAAAKSLPSYEAMMALVDKIFPAQPDPDPARLASARISVQAMWPDGSYAKMVSGFVGNITTSVMRMKKSDLASLASKPTKTMANTASSDRSIHDQAAAKDPYFDQRMAATFDVIHEEIGKISAVIDPRMRDGLARAMARRFDARQLGDINAFFATSSGHALASEYMQLWLEPETMRSMFGVIPEMMKLMPDATQKLKAVNDRFPKPATPPTSPPKH